MTPNFIKAGNFIIPINDIREILTRDIEDGWIEVQTYSGGVYMVSGFDLIEAVWLLKPSAFEGRRLKWNRHVWAFHNFIGHPVMQILAWTGLKKQAIKFHDWTVPKPIGFKNG